MSKPTTFAGRLRTARTEASLTMRELGLRADVSQKAISELERRKTTPRATTIVRLATALGTTPDALNPDASDDLRDMARLAEYHLLVVRCCGGRPVVEGKVCAHCMSNDPPRRCDWVGIDLDAKVRIAK